MNCYAEADTARTEAPDLVIVATGGIPDTDWFEGSELCDSAWDVLTGTVPGKSDVLVYDGAGRQAAASCALRLAGQGSSVCIATPDDALAIEMSYIDKSSFRKRFAELGIRSFVDVRLEKVERRGNALPATFRNELTGAESQVEAGQVVVEYGTLPAAPAPGRFLLHRIGDAVSSRDLYSAIYEAYRLCSKL